MNESILERNRSSVNFATKDFLNQLTKLYMNEFTPERLHSNANFVKRHLLILVTKQYMNELTREKNPSIVSFAKCPSFLLFLKLHMSEFTPPSLTVANFAKSHTKVKVRKIDMNELILVLRYSNANFAITHL